MENLNKYLELTGQHKKELLAGEQQYGQKYIDDLIDQALKENKKIVFVPELTNGQDLGLGKYELQPL